jgi:hypothetical protein
MNERTPQQAYAALQRLARDQGRTSQQLFELYVHADRIPVVSAVDRALFGYFASKLAAERVVAESGLPWTTLRATQLHDLLLATAQQLARALVLPAAAGFRFQPIDAGEVAARLADLALAAPAGCPTWRGHRCARWARCCARTCGPPASAGRSCPVWLPGRAARAVRDGANLAPDRAVGRRTWEQFLAERATS